jgi:predicted lysophospholipase L1 biosynthesis ABC-type transport system permease subunit
MAGERMPHTVTVVGIATFPTVGIVHAAHTSLGIGALVVLELVPGFDRDIRGIKKQGLGPSAIFIRYRPGTDPDAELQHLRDTTKPLAGFAGLDVLQVQRPAEIASSGSIGSAPILLATALATAATISLALALGASVRRRRRELAILKMLGFTRRQLAATISWQATTTVGLGLLIGTPAGAAIGGILWRLFAHQFDVITTPTVPLFAILGITVAAVLIANAVGAIPGRTARTVDPSTLLRPE